MIGALDFPLAAAEVVLAAIGVTEVVGEVAVAGVAGSTTAMVLLLVAAVVRTMTGTTTGATTGTTTGAGEGEGFVEAEAEAEATEVECFVEAEAEAEAIEGGEDAEAGDVRDLGDRGVSPLVGCFPWAFWGGGLTDGELGVIIGQPHVCFNFLGGGIHCFLRGGGGPLTLLAQIHREGAHSSQAGEVSPSEQSVKT